MSKISDRPLQFQTAHVRTRAYRFSANSDNTRLSYCDLSIFNTALSTVLYYAEMDFDHLGHQEPNFLAI